MSFWTMVGASIMGYVLLGVGCVVLYLLCRGLESMLTQARMDEPSDERNDKKEE